jgi:hypothetical protein
MIGASQVRGKAVTNGGPDGYAPASGKDDMLCISSGQRGKPRTPEWKRTFTIGFWIALLQIAW